MADTLHVESHRDGTVIHVQAQPRAARSEVVGPHDGMLRIRITAPPVEGAANTAIVNLLSDLLGVRRSAVEVVSGASGRRKRVLVRGLSPAEVRQRLRGR